MVDFIDSHTKTNAGGVSSTFRDSKSAPFHWRSDLEYSEVLRIEEDCQEAMKLWGYLKVTNASMIKDFNPLTSYAVE